MSSIHTIQRTITVLYTAEFNPCKEGLSNYYYSLVVQTKRFNMAKPNPDTGHDPEPLQSL